jgi:hypothetical protein
VLRASSTHGDTTGKEKRRPHSTAALDFSESCKRQECYDDLYLTEQPYGFVSGVLTDLPDND